MTMAGKWAWSKTGEHYFGTVDTKEEAIAEARASGDRYVGQCRDAEPPETFVDAEYLLENISVQEEYSGEWAEDWWQSWTKEQLSELESSLKEVVADWLDKHDLRPTFWIVDPDTVETVE